MPSMCACRLQVGDVIRAKALREHAASALLATMHEADMGLDAKVNPARRMGVWAPTETTPAPCLSLTEPCRCVSWRWSPSGAQGCRGWAEGRLTLRGLL